MASPSHPEYKLKVAICGGGIGGLGFAVALSRYAPDVKVDVYEASGSPGELGLSIALNWRTSIILEELGLRGDIESIGGQFDFTKLANLERTRDDLGRTEPIPKKNQPEVRHMSLHRAKLLSVLFNRLGTNCTTHTSKRVTSYVQPDDSKGPITILFADDSKETCDILIGCDGLKSSVRATMVEELASFADAKGDSEAAGTWRSFSKPSFTGIVTYRAMYPAEKLEQLSPSYSSLAKSKVLTGKGSMLATFVVNTPAGPFRYFALSHSKPDLEGAPYPEPWVSEGEYKDMADYVPGWSKVAQDIIACAEGPVKKWALHVVRGIPVFSHIRVAILGDAAHGMTPFLGSGAGQAFEDAYCLAKLLGHPLTTRETASQALKAYSQIRQPIAQRFVENSREMGLLSTSGGDDFSAAETGARADALMDILAQGSPLEDTKRAIALFETFIV